MHHQAAWSLLLVHSLQQGPEILLQSVTVQMSLFPEVVSCSELDCGRGPLPLHIVKTAWTYLDLAEFTSISSLPSPAQNITQKNDTDKNKENSELPDSSTMWPKSENEPGNI